MRPTGCGWPISYYRTRAGWAYTAFVTDVYARKVVGWKVATEMTQKLVTDAINYAIHSRKRSGATNLAYLIHHSDAGAQYTAVAFTEHLALEGILPSIGTVGDSFDHALVESVKSSYKTELIDHQPLYPGATELSLATDEWVAFYNRKRPNGYCQDLTPDRTEALYYHRHRHPHTEDADGVVDVLECLALTHGAPHYVRFDNGPWRTRCVIGADSTVPVHFSLILARRGRTPGSNRLTAGSVTNCSTRGGSTRCWRPA
jgi:hypothetical protein